MSAVTCFRLFFRILLELFSKPMEEREAFLPKGKNIEVRHGSNVVYAIGEGGALFDHFELMLPRGTTVSRIDPRSIQLKTNRFSMRVVVGFEGFNSVLPRKFEDLYLGRGIKNVTGYQVDLDITVHFNPWSLLSATGWEYYRWLDSFLDRIDTEFSFTRFLEDIGWETALSTAIIAKHMATTSQTGSRTTPGDEQPKLEAPQAKIGSGESPAGLTKQVEPSEL